MPFSYTCPHCGKEIFAEDRYAGQTGPCVECGKTITMPGTPVSTTPPATNSAPTAVNFLTTQKTIVLLAIIGMAVLCYKMLPYIQGSSEMGRRLHCGQNLKLIHQAMQSYSNAYGQFPPAYTVDSSGKKLHSWRTLLLPYLGHKDIYDELNLEEPWDSTVNQKIFDDWRRNSVNAYHCPSSPYCENPTAYVMVIGPNSVSNGPTGWRLSDLANRPSETIYIVETAFPFQWYEPEDLKVDEITFGINCGLLPDYGDSEEEIRNAGVKPSISSYHRIEIGNGVNVLYCDGSVKFLRKETDPFTLKAMIEGKKRFQKILSHLGYDISKND